VVGRRPAWCPRCDELRQGRAGSACPVCSARLVGLPRVATAVSWQAGRDALLRRVRSRLPVLRAVAAAVALLALLVGGFVAGRAAAPARAAPAAPATTTPPSLTLPGGRALSGSFRDFGWRAVHGRVSLTLRSIFATRDTTNLVFEAAGLESGWSLETVGDLHLLNGQGRELAAGRLGEDLPVFRAREAGPGLASVAVALQGRVDPGAVARVTVGRLVLGQRFEDHLTGTLVDAQLKRLIDQAQGGRPNLPAACQSCRLRVRCLDCQGVRVAGTAYRRGQVTLLLGAAGADAGGDLPGHTEIVVSGSGGPGQINALNTTLESGDTMVTFDARQLAEISERGQATMSFTVTATRDLMRTEQGPWQIDRQSGAR
jgi:hypothetical protein